MKKIAIILSILILTACTSKEKKHQYIYIVHTQHNQSTLFFNGTIQPLHTTVITCPAEGTITATTFQYGAFVKANQPLFKLASPKFLDNYKTAFMQYIKAKNDFDTSNTQLKEAAFLHRHLLISDDDYKAKQSAYYAAQLTWLQAKDSLQIFLNRLHISNESMSLDITSIDKINHALHLDSQAQNLQIVSPVDGVVLAPLKNQTNNKKINQGDTVKEDDVLALIGDMSGLSVEINVNEMTVNQLTLGQTVHVTGPAFPNMILTGTITRIDHQADVIEGNLPVFAVTVTVPHLTATEQSSIHVGMSANVDIINDEGPEILVPINALIEKQGHYYVNLSEANRKNKEVLVETGKTTPTDIIILAGLHDGDRLVVTD